MKALTLWQPWASLVALGVKTIETRSWSTDYRGPLAIHAAARPAERQEVGRLIVERPDAWNAWHAAGLAPNGAIQMPYGVVVATCRLVDVVQTYPALLIDWQAEKQRPYGDFTPGRFAWLLDDIEALPEPVPARGRQKLWEWAA